MSVKSVKKVALGEQHDNQKGTCKAILAFTPLLILIITCCTMVLTLNKPFTYAKNWAVLVFRADSQDVAMDKDNPYKRADAPQMKATVPIPKTPAKDDKDKKKDKNKIESDYENHEIDFPYYGDAYAKLTIDNKYVGVKDTSVFWGDGDDLLDQGLVQSNYSSYIGIPGRVVIAGHNHTYFVNFKNIKKGDKATLTTSYGKFVYEVTKTEIRHYTDTTLLYYDPTEKPVKDDLIMYTCWNNGYMGASEERLYAVCKLISREYTK